MGKELLKAVATEGVEAFQGGAEHAAAKEAAEKAARDEATRDMVRHRIQELFGLFLR